ncbi:hypothetical protein K439DRAFT_278071 [Ramaria rubella]|nr:hypothetical protein K439DRAFT_278071 [Ramaria rubella]
MIPSLFPLPSNFSEVTFNPSAGDVSALSPLPPTLQVPPKDEIYAPKSALGSLTMAIDLEKIAMIENIPFYFYACPCLQPSAAMISPAVVPHRPDPFFSVMLFLRPPLRTCVLPWAPLNTERSVPRVVSAIDKVHTPKIRSSHFQTGHSATQRTKALSTLYYSQCHFGRLADLRGGLTLTLLHARDSSTNQ